MKRKKYLLSGTIIVIIIVLCLLTPSILRQLERYKLIKGWTMMGNLLQAYTSKEMILSGIITDEKGKALDDVKVEIEKVKSYITPFSMGDTREKESLAMNSSFSFKYIGYHGMTFIFSKDGYYPVREHLTTIPSTTENEIKDRIKENLKIVLREIGELAQLRRGDIDVSWEKDEDGKILKRGWIYKARENEKYGVYERVNNIPYDDPSEVDIYAKKTEDGDGLYLIANGDAGFTEPFDAIDFTYVPEAPETGYKNKIKLSFLAPKPDEDGNHMRSKKMFLYFKLKEGLYGKASVEASESSDKTSYRIVCPYYLNPKGSRNLRSKEKF